MQSVDPDPLNTTAYVDTMLQLVKQITAAGAVSISIDTITSRKLALCFCIQTYIYDMGMAMVDCTIVMSKLHVWGEYQPTLELMLLYYSILDYHRIWLAHIFT